MRLLTDTQSIRLRPFRHIVIAAAVIAASVTAASETLAQAIPSPAEAIQMLQSNPELLSQLRERIAASGLTEEQIRARLRAEGYPESLLDAFFATGGSARTNASTRQIFQAVRDLGLTDEADLQELRRLAGIEDRAPTTTRVDTAARGDSTLSPESAEIFGLSLFRESTSQFMPNLDGPVDAGYRLGPGDQLTLILTGDVEQAHTLNISRQGTIVIPGVGQVSVANLTLGELEDLLYTRLGRVYSGLRRGAGATTQFSVTVTELRSNQVFVTGDVMRPGSYRVTSAGTAFTALYAAGGPTDRGSLRNIAVRRNGELVATLDVYDYLIRGDASNDVRLQQGDVVFVPIHGERVRVDGAVARPATYEVKDGEGLDDVIAAAGGLSATAGGRRLVVERVLPIAERSTGRVRAVLDIPLDPDGAVPPFAAEDGDVVRVPGISDRLRDRILVSGHVWSAGPQGFTPGLTLTEALRRAGGVQPDAYLGTVHIARLMSDSTRVQLRAMLVDTTGATVEPFLLQGDDQITVYSRTAFRPERHVVIGGAVRDGGRFAWRDGMTLRDLVLLAGGLEQGAYLREAEIARLSGDDDAQTTAVTIRVPLDSGYLFSLASSATGGRGSDVPLEPYDNVLILRDPTWNEPRTVWITGEVRFPGRYTLKSRDERISTLLERAGGFTEQADPRGAFFSRLTDSSMVQRMIAARMDSVSLALGAAGDAKGPAPKPRMRIGVDLRDAMRGRPDDFRLEAGDSLHVPARSQVVQVRGAVHMPAALAYDSGADLDDYMRAAGGTTGRALTREVYVIQPNGKIETRRHFLWLIAVDPTPLPGAVVVVPERTAGSGGLSMVQTFGVVAQVLTALATIVVVTR